MRLLGRVFIILIGLWTALLISNIAEGKRKKTAHAVKPKPIVSMPIKGTVSLISEINRAIASVDPNLNIGVAVKSMKQGDTLYLKNQHRSFVPASILKVLTAEAALLYLGPQYKFATRLHADNSAINSGVVNGNLYLVHSGDPTLTYNDLVDLMIALKSQQINQVIGNVYIDTTAYDQAVYGPGWIWNDTRYCYAAPISASIINHNCLSFQVAPSKMAGNRANIIPSPNYYYSGFRNDVVTKAGKNKSCYIHLDANSDSTISLSGCVSKDRAQGISTVIHGVVEYNKSLLRDLFKRYGIAITGVVTSGIVPANAPVLAIHESRPLHEMVTDMLKKSDNIIAGSLFKKMGELYSKQPGTWQNGSLAVSQVLSRRAGVNTSQMNVLDGSGLSRYNQITPAQMLQVLDFAYHNYTTNYDFISALPVAGVDGTLKHRLSNIVWKVRAKTGTMSGVNALAGYAITNDKETLAFVIIVNGHNGMGWRYKELEDRIVTVLTKYSRG